MRSATSAACSSRCTAAAASATTCSPSARRRSSASTPGSPRSTTSCTSSRHVPRCECGTPMLRGSRFCPSCGRELTAGDGDVGGDGRRARARSRDARRGAADARGGDRGRGRHVPALRRGRAGTGRYCLDCGLAPPRRDRAAAPPAAALDPAFRLVPRRLGLGCRSRRSLVAIAGAAAAIAISGHRADAHAVVDRRDARIRAHAQPRPVQTVDDTRRAREHAARCPMPPEPGDGVREERPPHLADRRERLDDRARLVSARRPAHDSGARDRDAGREGRPSAGRRARLEPTSRACSRATDVVFTGIYGSKHDADAAVATARQAGFGGAYSRQIAR